MKRSIPPYERAITQGIILRFVRCGYHHRGAAEAAGIHRATLYRWLSLDPSFAVRFALAWEAGTRQREFRMWLAHPFRGNRPPTTKRTRDFPRFGQPRAARSRPR